MKFKSALFILPFLLAFNNEPGDGLFGIRLKTISNENYSFDALAKNKGSVIVFLLPDCPACESYSRTLNDLRAEYKNSGFEFYGVFPGTFNTTDEMKTYQTTYRISFPLLQDPENILVKKLNANTVPSAFLVDKNGAVLYKGRIDDWLYALGKKRAVITKHDLHDALSAVKNGKPVKVKETTPIGCILE